jgi:hypothetical protein
VRWRAELILPKGELQSHGDPTGAACTLRTNVTSQSPRSRCAASFDHLVGQREHFVWNLEAKRLGGLEVDRPPSSVGWSILFITVPFRPWRTGELERRSSCGRCLKDFARRQSARPSPPSVTAALKDTARG